tara:strand:- start:1781 stop:2083 length:303 start_codon:yes stop_codon:yes gene_type:complete
MEKTDLIRDLELISLKKPNEIFRLKGHLIYNKEYLEIIIYKGFSSSTTHPIEFDEERNVIGKKYTILKCELLKAPLIKNSEFLIKETNNMKLSTQERFWD